MTQTRNEGRAGALIVVTGPDAAGKSSQADMLAKRLRDQGVRTLLTHEPWESEYGVRIRDRLRVGDARDAQEMAMMFALDRHAHVRDLMRPHMESGGVVVTTRYIDSSLIYNGAEMERQGHPRGMAWVKELNSLFPPADLYVVLHASPEVLRARIVARADDADSYERDVARQERVQELYRGLHTHFAPDTVRYVCADARPDQVHAEVWQLVRGIPMLSRCEA